MEELLGKSLERWEFDTDCGVRSAADRGAFVPNFCFMFMFMFLWCEDLRPTARNGMEWNGCGGSGLCTYETGPERVNGDGEEG